MYLQIRHPQQNFSSVFAKISTINSSLNIALPLSFIGHINRNKALLNAVPLSFEINFLHYLHCLLHVYIFPGSQWWRTKNLFSEHFNQYTVHVYFNHILRLASQSSALCQVNIFWWSGNSHFFLPLHKNEKVCGS